MVLQVGSTVQTMIGYHCAHLVKPVSSKHHATKQDVIFLSSVSSVKLDVPYSWLSVVVLQVGSTVQTMIGYHCVHLLKPVSSTHRATKQDVIFLSSVSSVKLDVPCSWPNVVVFQVGSTAQTMIGYHFAHLVKPVSSKHHATKQDVIFLSSVSSVKLDVPCSWISLIVVQVGSTVQTMFGFTVHILWGQWVPNIMQQSQMSSVYQAFPVSSLMYLISDQVWWFFKLVAQCKLWLATTVHILWSPWVVNIMQQSKMWYSCQAFQASSLMYLILDQMWWFIKLVAQCKLWLATTVHILWGQWVLNIMQQSKMSSFCQAF